MEEENNIFFTLVEEKEGGTRLDKFLTLKLDCSRAEIQRLIKTECVMINDVILTDTSHKIKPCDSITIQFPAPVEADPKPQMIPLDIVYEDTDLLVVNKPAGMVVHEGAGIYEGTLVNALLYHCGDSLSGIGGVKRPGIVHRIDKETSGLLVVAKNDTTHAHLSSQFEKHTIERTYIAFVYGVPLTCKGKIEGNIGRSKFDRKKMALLKTGGKSAVTHYSLSKAFGNYASKLSCRLETGRTHQIRVHLSSIGHHLIGDKIYTAPSKAFLKVPQDLKNYLISFERQALHAQTLGFIHPKTGEKLFFESPLPPDLQKLEEQLSTIIV